MEELYKIVQFYNQESIHKLFTLKKPYYTQWSNFINKKKPYQTKILYQYLHLKNQTFYDKEKFSYTTNHCICLNQHHNLFFKSAFFVLTYIPKLNSIIIWLIRNNCNIIKTHSFICIKSWWQTLNTFSWNPKLISRKFQ